MIYESPEFNEKWSEWIEYRKQRRLPKYVEIGLKKTLTAIYNDSGGDEEVAIQMIERAITHNWQGIHKINNENGKRVQTNGRNVADIATPGRIREPN